MNTSPALFQLHVSPKAVFFIGFFFLIFYVPLTLALAYFGYEDFKEEPYAAAALLLCNPFLYWFFGSILWHGLRGTPLARFYDDRIEVRGFFWPYRKSLPLKQIVGIIYIPVGKMDKARFVIYTHPAGQNAEKDERAKGHHLDLALFREDPHEIQGFLGNYMERVKQAAAQRSSR